MKTTLAQTQGKGIISISTNQDKKVTIYTDRVHLPPGKGTEFLDFLDQLLKKTHNVNLRKLEL